MVSGDHKFGCFAKFRTIGDLQWGNFQLVKDEEPRVFEKLTRVSCAAALPLAFFLTCTLVVTYANSVITISKLKHMLAVAVL